MKGRCKLEMLNKSSVWPGTNRNIENLATFVATLPWVALLALLVCIDLVSSSARVTWVKSQNWDSWKLSFRCFDYVSLCKEFLILVAADQHGCYFATTEIWRRIPFAFMVFCHRADQTIQSDQKQRQPFEFWLNLTNIARAAAIKSCTTLFCDLFLYLSISCIQDEDNNNEYNNKEDNHNKDSKDEDNEGTKLSNVQMFLFGQRDQVVYKVSLSYKSIFYGLALPEIWLNIVVLPFWQIFFAFCGRGESWEHLECRGGFDTKGEQLARNSKKAVTRVKGIWKDFFNTLRGKVKFLQRHCWGLHWSGIKGRTVGDLSDDHRQYLDGSKE